MFRVAIVGRPNVGKSSLFNRIIRKRKSIIEDIPGVTRDRIVSVADWRGKNFELVDTGGFLTGDDDKFAPYIRKQIEKELDLSDMFILTVDAKTGLTALDKDIAKLLHKTEKPVIVAVNKADNQELENSMYEFYELGFEKIFPVSSIQRTGVGELLDEVVKHIPDEKGKETKKEEKKDYIKVALVGKPNAGKSSILNAILKEERVLVSDIPGTTRDTVDTEYRWKDKDFLFLDTAGMKKKKKVEYGVDFFSVGRSLESIKKADVVVLVIDATEGVTEQDQRIAHLIQKYTKPAVILVNKMDMIVPSSEARNAVLKHVRERLYFISYAPILLVSAKTREGIRKIPETIVHVYNQALKRVGTGQLNRAIEQITSLQKPPSYMGKPVKIYYATQLEGKPPAFLLFVNKPEGFKENYLRFIENNLRTMLGFENAPIKLLLRSKESSNSRR
jgi:GTP-binding protein